MKALKSSSTNIKACNWTLLKHHVLMAIIAMATLATVSAGVCPHPKPEGELVLGFQCPEPNGMYKNPKDCHSFYICRDGVARLGKCSGGFEWNDEDKICDFPEDARCKISG
ncbi:Cytidine deaminase 5 [Lobosporangium transversale]|nr:Cytidine deaminase 5 [Lobosporangium transversale]